MAVSIQRFGQWVCSFCASIIILVAAVGAASADEAPKLKLQKGDHVILVGNTLAERMQYFGHWEALLHSRFPDVELVVRDLGWSADEVGLRPRSLDFAHHGDTLAGLKPDVVLAFFGFNESFAGKEGLPRFEIELDAFIKEITSTNYNGKNPPQLVLVSPISHENLHQRGLPDGKANNANIELYTQAIAKAAKAHNIVFVDLFAASKQFMVESSAPLTINGIHLNERGDAAISRALDEALFGPRSQPKIDLDKLLAAVNEKNQQFFYDHRAVNGYYIYGDRKRPFGVRNFPEEFAKLRKMVDNRDRRIWDIAQGKSVPAEIDDSNTGPLPETETNFQKAVVISAPEDEIKSLKVPDGFEVSLFASEEQFPDLQKPVAMTFDARGRLWVATMPSYPHYVPGSPPNDKVLILEDTNADGKADTCKVFADKLYLPTGLELGFGKVFVSEQPNLITLQDTNGDDRADKREMILHGFDSADSHHGCHAFVWDPGMALYFQEGTFLHTQIETPYGPVRSHNAAVYRFEPRNWKLDNYISYGFANPWGHCFDRWGQDFIADASGGANYFAGMFSGDVDYPNKHANIPERLHLLRKQWRPTAGCELVSSRNFPDEIQGNYLLNNVIGFQGTLQYKLREKDSGFFASPIEPMLTSDDSNSRPCDLEFGPDGALYVVDWFNPLIGHMQHSIRDPNRDHTHGRIWRITYKNRRLVTPPKIAGERISQLLDLLKRYEDRTRYRVRIELSSRRTDDVMPALDRWIDRLDKKDPDYEHHMLEALWVRQQHDMVDEKLLNTLLKSPNYHARAAATRVLCYWRDRVQNPLDLLQDLVADENPHVRLEAVRALSFFKGKDADKALEVALMSLLQPQDDYLAYTLDETRHTLEKRAAGEDPLAQLKEKRLTDKPGQVDNFLTFPR